MPSDPRRAALTTPGHLRFPTNLLFAQDLEQVGGRVSCQVTGHLVFYRPDGRRFLATDPEGNPLHECEWGTDSTGEVALLRARIRLDWGQWVGLKPAGLVNETRLNLAGKPGWQRLTADDLRTMAAQALRVPLEEVRFFYRDEDRQPASNAGSQRKVLSVPGWEVTTGPASCPAWGVKCSISFLQSFNSFVTSTANSLCFVGHGL
jgi:hypothetical protein